MTQQKSRCKIDKINLTSNDDTKIEIFNWAKSYAYGTRTRTLDKKFNQNRILNKYGLCSKIFTFQYIIFRGNKFLLYN